MSTFSFIMRSVIKHAWMKSICIHAYKIAGLKWTKQKTDMIYLLCFRTTNYKQHAEYTRHKATEKETNSFKSASFKQASRPDKVEVEPLSCKHESNLITTTTELASKLWKLCFGCWKTGVNRIGDQQEKGKKVWALLRDLGWHMYVW